MLEFGTFVSNARASNRSGTDVPAVPAQTVYGDGVTEATDYHLPDQDPSFSDKLSIGQFFSRVIPQERHEEARMDVGLWTWLAAKYFDQITAARTKMKEERAYVASLSFQDFYRHLLLGPYYVYSIA